MIFRQLFDLTSSTYTYLLACSDTKQAVLIDPVFEQAQRDLALLNELGLTLECVLDTHCHADHVTAAWVLKQKTGCAVASAAVIRASDVDRPLNNGDVIEFGRESVTVYATPGHTDGCLSFVTADKSKAFTGDALLIRGCGRCDFQQGNAKTLYHSITQQLFTLPDECAIYPGHDYNGRTQSTVAEEKKFNARVGGNASEEDFAGYMDNMQLPHPKLIDHAVPANLKSGKPEAGELKPEPSWAPISFTFSGVPELEVEWVINNRDKVQILDVRETGELESPVDRLTDTTIIPLGELRGKTEQLSKNKPIVCLCRSGRRSAMAVSILQKAGFTDVANIAGGMLRWKELS
jgi:glyoxylase-like metal-dependent hydrolase (beta-lactamase superfamily II)/rhodanese-related sulfurtransferase